MDRVEEVTTVASQVIGFGPVEEEEHVGIHKLESFKLLLTSV